MPLNPRPKDLAGRCAAGIGLTRAEVMAIARTAPKRYKIYLLRKRSGGFRTICHPSRELKRIQRIFLRQELVNLQIHEAATAYKTGASIFSNADRHKSSRVILKLDFESFFNSIRVEDWYAYCRAHMPNWMEKEIEFSAKILFWGEGTYAPRCLSIGAPTSPLLSNALMYEFDVKMAKYAEDNDLVYSRYADDLTFSTQNFIDQSDVIEKVTEVLLLTSVPGLKINNSKTRIVSKSNSRRVTGLVITNGEKISLGRDRKRLWSSMIHRALQQKMDQGEQNKLMGYLAFAEGVEPTFVRSMEKKYGVAELNKIRMKNK